MKKLTCDMCGSTDMMKENGVFVCQTCGCKYSVEEAKKMMVEGTVDVSGSTIKVDHSEELENLFELARRSRSNNDIESAAMYYNQILTKNPHSWEACFYSVYCKISRCKIGEIPHAMHKLSYIEDVLSLIKEHVLDDDERTRAVAVVVRDTHDLALSMYEAYNKFYQDIPESLQDDYTNDWISAMSSKSAIRLTILDCLERMFADDEPFMIKFGCDLMCDLMEGLNRWSEAPRIQKVIDRYIGIVDQRREEEKQRRIEAYWNAHASEKAELEAEFESNISKIADMQVQIDAVSKEISPQIADLNRREADKASEIAEITKQIGTKVSEMSMLEKTRATLGFFKRKQKVAITAEIHIIEHTILDDLRKKLRNAENDQTSIKADIAALDARVNELNSELAKLKGRQEEITEELTKSR